MDRLHVGGSTTGPLVPAVVEKAEDSPNTPSSFAQSGISIIHDVPAFGDEQFFLPSDLDLFDEDAQGSQQQQKSQQQSGLNVVTSLLGSPVQGANGTVGDNAASAGSAQESLLHGRSVSEDRSQASPSHAQSDSKSRKLCRHFPNCTHPTCEFFHPHVTQGGRFKDAQRSLTRGRSADVASTMERPWLLNANGEVRLPLKKHESHALKDAQRLRGYSMGDANLDSRLVRGLSSSAASAQRPVDMVRKAPLLSMGETQLNIHRKNTGVHRMHGKPILSGSSSPPRGGNFGANNKYKSPRQGRRTPGMRESPRKTRHDREQASSPGRPSSSSEWHVVEGDRVRHRKAQSSARLMLEEEKNVEASSAGSDVAQHSSPQLSESQETHRLLGAGLSETTDEASSALNSSKEGAEDEDKHADAPHGDSRDQQQQQEQRRRKQKSPKPKRRKRVNSNLQKEKRAGQPKTGHSMHGKPHASTTKSYVERVFGFFLPFLLSCLYTAAVAHESAIIIVLSDVQAWITFGFSFILPYIHSTLIFYSATSAIASTVCVFMESFFFLGLLFWLGHLHDKGHLMHVWMRSFRGVFLLARFVMWSALGLQLWHISLTQRVAYAFAVYVVVSKRGAKDFARLVSSIALVLIACLSRNSISLAYIIITAALWGIHAIGHNQSHEFKRAFPLSTRLDWKGARTKNKPKFR